MEGYQDFKNLTLVKNESEFAGHMNPLKAGVKKALSYDSLRPEEFGNGFAAEIVVLKIFEKF